MIAQANLPMSFSRSGGMGRSGALRTFTAEADALDVVMLGSLNSWLEKSANIERKHSVILPEDDTQDSDAVVSPTLVGRVEC